MGGNTVWSSIADYRPPPLEVLRNPWIQWTVLLPRDISGPEYSEIHRIGPEAIRALGVTDALTHMEWFRRPDGSVAVSEVAARPPGAQLTSMHGYAHDFDLFRAWAELVVLDRFEPPPRQYAAGTAYLRGQGHGRVGAVRGLEGVQRDLGHLVMEARLPQPGQQASHEYTGEGYVIVRHPETGVVDHALPGSSPRSASSWWRPCDATTVVMLSPGYPMEMAYFTRGLAAVGARVIGVGDQPSRRAPRRRALGAGALRARLAGRRERRPRRAPRAGPARLVRPGRVPVGAVHAARGPRPRGVRAARHDDRRRRCRSATRRT